MIYIKEIFPDDQSVMIQVEGIIDCATMATLDDVCRHHLKTGKKVQLNLGGIIHISRSGREFLQKIEKQVCLLNTPAFIRF